MKSLMVLFLFVTSAAWADGVGSSGGGIGVQCNGQLSTLDLYEAVNVHGLTLDTSAGDLDANLVKYFHKFWEYYSTDPIPSDQSIIADTHKWMNEKIVDVAPGSLSLSQDATLPTLPNGCRFIQIALYDDTADKIYLDRSLWNRLDSRNQAELMLHENVYKIARDFRARTSDDTRKVLANLFSDQTVDSEFQNLNGREGLMCATGFEPGTESPTGQWIVFVNDQENGVSGIRGYYWFLNGYILLSRTKSFTPGLSIESILSKGFPAQTIVAHQELINRNWLVEIGSDTGAEPASPYFEVNLRAHQMGTAPEAFTKGFCSKVTLGASSGR